MPHKLILVGVAGAVSALVGFGVTVQNEQTAPQSEKLLPRVKVYYAAFEKTDADTVYSFFSIRAREEISKEQYQEKLSAARAALKTAGEPRLAKWEKTGEGEHVKSIGKVETPVVLSVVLDAGPQRKELTHVTFWMWELPSTGSSDWFLIREDYVSAGATSTVSVARPH